MALLDLLTGKSNSSSFLSSTDKAASNFGGLSLGLEGFAAGQQNATDVANLEERAAIARFNAEVAENEAISIEQQTRAGVSDFKKQQSANVAASRAAQAGEGFTMAGSPMMVDEATLTAIEFSVARQIHGGRVAARQKRDEASLLRRTAKVDDQNARSQKTAGVLGVFGAALKGLNVGLGKLPTSPTTITGPLDVRPPAAGGTVDYSG
jgi:hypothetical protein